MSYQVIARKYRPQRFQDVVGQEHVCQTLTHAIAQQRIAHAYLFCGPRGTGKTTLARIFAKCLNCTDGPKVDFAETDPRCTEITEGRSLDVLEIDGASNNGVEQVRELRESARFAPVSSRFKIYIIDEVHMLSTSAFNALLKTLEEPPAHVKFMFATTDPEKVLPTILSRCQRFDLRRIPVSLIVKHLTTIAAAEKVEIDSSALHAIGRGADGGMRDAESALDQLISFCGDRIVETDVLSMFGLTAQSQILALTQAILGGDVAGALRELNELVRHGKDLGRLLGDLLSHCRNLMIYQVTGGDFRLLEVSETEGGSLAQQAALVSTDALTRVMEVLTEAENGFRHAASKKIFVEVSLVRAIEARNAIGLDAVLRQLNQLRAGAGASAPAVVMSAPAVVPAVSRPAVAAPPQVTSPVPVVVSAPPISPGTLLPETPAPAPTAAAAGEGGLAGLWRELVEAVGRASPFARSYLLEAFPVSLTNRVLTIGFDPEFADHLALVDNAKNHTLLGTKLHELGHPQTQVKFVAREAPARASAPFEKPAASRPQPSPVVAPITAPIAPAPISAPAPAPRAPVKPASEPSAIKDFKNDPLIQKALEMFKARLVEVGG